MITKTAMPRLNVVPPDAEALYDADAICQRWGITRRTLNRWLADGIPGTREPIPHLRLGRALRFSEAQVRYIEAAMARSAAAARRRRRA